MNTKQQTLAICFLAISVLVSGCGPGQLFGPTVTPTPTATHTPTATLTPSATPTITPTATFTLTPTPVLLQCTIIKTKFQKYPFNVYALTGEFFPNTGSSAPEIEAVQVDIVGEAGEAIRKPTVTVNLSLDFTKVAMDFTDTRTYKSSQNSYEITGSIDYELADFGKISEYNFTVKGGIFGTKSQHCGSKT